MFVARIVYTDSVRLGFEVAHWVSHCWLFKATTLPRKVGNRLPSDAASHFNRKEAQATQLRKPQTSQLYSNSPKYKRRLFCLIISTAAKHTESVLDMERERFILLSIVFLETCLLRSIFSEFRRICARKCTFTSMQICIHGAIAPSGTGRPHYRGFTITDTQQSMGFL